MRKRGHNAADIHKADEENKKEWVCRVGWGGVGYCGPKLSLSRIIVVCDILDDGGVIMTNKNRLE